MSDVWENIPGPAGRLAVHVAPGSAAPGAATPTLVVCHGLPVEPGSARRTGRSFPALADRLAAESGWRVVTGCLRGVGMSSGDFSMAGWLEDLGALVDRAASLANGAQVRVAGFGTSGALALCLAKRDDRIGGVACLGAPGSFSEWAVDLPRMLALCREVGIVQTPGFPGSAADLAAWGAPLSNLHPESAAAALGTRPVLIVHGADDDSVPVGDARVLAERAGPSAELRILAGAGHRLRADPRAVAILVGWLDRGTG